MSAMLSFVEESHFVFLLVTDSVLILHIPDLRLFGLVAIWRRDGWRIGVVMS